MKNFIQIVVLGNVRYMWRRIMAQVFYSDGQSRRPYGLPLSRSERHLLRANAEWRESQKRYLMANDAKVSDFKSLYV